MTTKTDCQEGVTTQQMANTIVGFAWYRIGRGYVDIARLSDLSDEIKAYLDDIDRRGARIMFDK